MYHVKIQDRLILMGNIPNYIWFQTYMKQAAFFAKTIWELQ